jgi:hypothetical protein
MEAQSTLACPQCGGVSPLPSGQRLVVCGFCEATLFVDRSAVVSHYQLPRLLDAEQAAAALRRWMAGNDTVKDLDQKATLTAVEPVAFPVWLFRGRTAAGEVARVEPAAPTPIPQLADLKLPAGQLTPYRAEAVESVAATVPLETARGWLGQDVQVLESALVALPLWRCRYRYDDEEFTALVEGSTGAVLASVFPAKAESPFYLAAGLGVLVFLGAGFAIGNPLLKMVAYGVLALPLALLHYWVARKV